MDVFPRIAAVQGTSATTWTLLPVTAIAAVMVAHHFLQIRVCMKIVPYQQEIAWKDGNVDHEGHTQESLTVLDGERKRYDVLILARGATLTEAEGGRRVHSQGKGAESPTANYRWRCVVCRRVANLHREAADDDVCRSSHGSNSESFPRRHDRGGEDRSAASAGEADVHRGSARQQDVRTWNLPCSPFVRVCVRHSGLAPLLPPLLNCQHRRISRWCPYRER